jgi:hypothetical protein
MGDQAIDLREEIIGVFRFNKLDPSEAPLRFTPERSITGFIWNRVQDVIIVTHLTFTLNTRQVFRASGIGGTDQLTTHTKYRLNSDVGEYDSVISMPDNLGVHYLVVQEPLWIQKVDITDGSLANQVYLAGLASSDYHHTKVIRL